MNQQVHDGVHRAFDLASDHLKEESAVSPHARQYHGIVEDLRRLIHVVRGRMTSKRRELNRCYVDRVTLYAQDDGSAADVPMASPWEPADMTDWNTIMFDETQEVFISGWEEWLGSSVLLTQEPEAMPVEFGGGQ